MSAPPDQTDAATLNSLLDIAIRAADAGALELVSRAGRATGVEYKTTSTDPVSDADRASEAAVGDLLRAERPGDGLLGEEGMEREGTTGLRWVVDPLDGTVNYLYGIPHYAVCVGCEQYDGTDWHQLVGVVHDPVKHEIFTAVRGAGSFLNGARLAVNDPVALGQALIGTGFSYLPPVRAEEGAVVAELLPIARDIRRSGSAALDLCWVAAGRYDGYYEGALKRWDWAAAALVASEAGAVISPLGAGFVVSGPSLHAELFAAVSGLHSPPA
jgi:myo-inositol-1(or 4)-monophosphatase